MKKLILVMAVGAMGLLVSVMVLAGGVEKDKFHKEKCESEIQEICVKLNLP